MRLMKASLTIHQRQCIAVFFTAWFLSSCGIEGLPIIETNISPELGAANEEPAPTIEPEIDSENPDDNNTPSVNAEESGQSGNTEEGESPNESEPSVTDAPDEELEPFEENSPSEEMEPVGESNTDEEIEPVSENTPTGDNEPAEENNPTDEVDPPVETVMNLAPIIQDTSYACDPILESVSFTVGETDNFTLLVDDEFPLSITFMADSSSPDVISVSVDENGIFTATAMKPGNSYLWLSASDHEGLVDEYELNVIVE